MDDRRAQLAQLATGQFGLVTSTQLRALGFDDHQRRYLLVSGVIEPLRRSVYTVAGVPPSWEQVVLAAVLAAGQGAVVSHTTAGTWWQLKHCPRAGTERGIHLSAAGQLRLTGVTGHRRDVPPEGRRVYRGVPVTSPELTIVDLAETIGGTQLGECIDDAMRRGLVRLDRLGAMAGSFGGPGRRSSRAVRLAVAERVPGDDPGANDWEREMDRCWDRLGLPAGVRQYRVRANGRAYRLDRALPDLKIGVEWNGFETHGTRSGFDRDSDKRADLIAAGWIMLDFTSRSSPERIRTTVLGAIRQRAAAEAAAAEAEAAGRPGAGPDQVAAGWPDRRLA